MCEIKLLPSTCEVHNEEEPKLVDVALLLPHEVYHAIHACNADEVGPSCCVSIPARWQFHSLMLGHFDGEAILDLWRGVKTLNMYKRHPVHRTSDGVLAKTVPVSIHADGAEMFRDSEFFVWSWSSCIAPWGLNTDILLQKIPICIISEQQMLDVRASQIV